MSTLEKKKNLILICLIWLIWLLICSQILGNTKNASPPKIILFFVICLLVLYVKLLAVNLLSGKINTKINTSIFCETMRKHDKTITGHTEVFNVWLNHHSIQNFYCNDMQLYHTIINKNIKINIKYSSRQHHRLTKNAFFMNQ